MFEQTTKIKAWWGEGEDYHIGESPSPYVQKEGINFLTQYLNSDDTLVDFGVWNGRNLPILLGLTKNIVATDIIEARPAVSVAKKCFPQVKFFETTLTALPFDGNAIDGGICWRVLHNLIGTEEIINSLKEINRVLKPNAPLLIAVRSEEGHQFWKKIYSYIKWKPNGAGGFRRDIYFTNESLALLATLMGFEVIYMSQIREKETINGQEVKNQYLAAHLLKKKNTMDSAWMDMVRRLIVRLD